MSQHLTMEELGQCLAGETPAHLAACAACRNEVAGMIDAVEGFRRAARQWSNQRPPLALVATSAAWAPPRWRLAPALGLAVLVLLAAAIRWPGMWNGGKAPASPAGEAVGVVAEDDQMLMRLQMQSEQAVPAALAPLELSDAPAEPR